MANIRLQKIIADAGICSRRKAEDLIRDRKVRVNGEMAKIGQSADPEKDEIIVDKKKISQEKKIYFLLNKPIGIVSTVSDEKGRESVVDLIKIEKRVVPIGRLDINTTGLLILTNDGDLVNKLTHPKFEHEKEYQALAQIPHDWNEARLKDAIQKMKSGVKIADDFKTSPAQVKILEQKSNDRYILSISIHEGRKHQVRQMIDACGMSVVALKRTRSGSLRIGDLKEGEWRELTSDEVEKLKK